MNDEDSLAACITDKEAVAAPRRSADEMNGLCGVQITKAGTCLLTLSISLGLLCLIHTFLLPLE
jgi:hypothetical protein